MVAVRAVSATHITAASAPAGISPVPVVLPVCADGDLLVATVSGRTDFPVNKGWAWSGQQPAQVSNYDDAVFVAYRYARAGESQTSEVWSLTKDVSSVTITSVYDVRPTNPIDVHFQMGNFAAVAAPSVQPTDTGGLLLLMFGKSVSDTSGATLSPNTATNYNTNNRRRHWLFRRQLSDTTTAVTGDYTLSGWGDASTVRGGSMVIFGNAAPNPPLLLAPAAGEAIDRTAQNVFTWLHTDPEGDLQVRAEFRWRPAGDTAWQATVHVSGPTPAKEFPGLFFPAGQIEWQVRTVDSGVPNKASLWSDSGFFTATSPPAGAVITSPTNGQVLDAASWTVTWTGDGTEFQIQRVSDNYGADGAISEIYFDSGVQPVTVRSYTLTFPVNSRYELIRVQEKKDGLWQQFWTVVRVLVSFTAPTKPVLSVVPVKTVDTPGDFTDALEVSVRNPAASGGEPAVAFNRLYVTATTVGDPLRPVGVRMPVVRELLSRVHTDHRVASGVDYAYEVEAVATNGASVMSDLVGDFRALGDELPGGGDEGDFVDAEYAPTDFD